MGGHEFFVVWVAKTSDTFEETDREIKVKDRTRFQEVCLRQY